MRRREAPPLPDDWFDDVEILILKHVYVGSFTSHSSWSVERWPELGNPVAIEAQPHPPDATTGTGLRVN